MVRRSDTVRVIRVFVSSPGDVADERAVIKEVVDSINDTDGEAWGFQLKLFRWEKDVTPRLGPKPQRVIDEQSPVYDIYVGIMSTRFGTPTGRYGSGTEEEFEQALKNWKKAGAPWIVFYFDAQPKMTGDPEQAKQYTKVCEFRSRLEKQGIVATYTGVRGTADGFYEKVSMHLRKIVQRIPKIRKRPPAGKRSKAAPAKPVVPGEYIAWLLDWCGEMELMGLEIKHGAGVRLNHVYTPLATSTRPEHEQDVTSRKRRIDPLEEHREVAQLLLDLFNERSLYISGDPGGGKSVFCRWVTWLICKGVMPSADLPMPEQYQEKFPDQLRGRLPVLVRLRDFWPHLPTSGVQSVGLAGLERAMDNWLTEQKVPRVDWPCLKAHLEAGLTVLMLDGVDEVPSVRKANGNEWYPREMLLDVLPEAIKRWTKEGNRVLVTSRPYGLDVQRQKRLGLLHAPIHGLDEALQALLVRRWFVCLNESRDRGLREASTMLDHLHGERALDELAANPLLLTAMCIIYDEGKRLPQDKYELYDRIVNTVLHKRYPSVRERAGIHRGRLGAIALGMHTGEGLEQERENPEAVASDREIDLLLQAYQQVDGSTDKGLSDTVHVREDLLSQSGLLVSRGGDRASFYHLSFQESSWRPSGCLSCWRASRTDLQISCCSAARQWAGGTRFRLCSAVW